MANNPINYLIGRGETLVQPITLATGGGEKAHPYTLDETIERLTQDLDLVGEAVLTLPTLACPNDEAVVAMTLHPSYLAKSFHPTRLLSQLGLRQVGSREQRIMPQKWTQKEPPSKPMVTAELFVAGKRSRLADFQSLILESRDSTIIEEYTRIEHIQPLRGNRAHDVKGDDKLPPLEVVLHADLAEFWGQSVLRGFALWCDSLGIDFSKARRQNAGGLAFIGINAPRNSLPKLADFTFLRTFRRMPKLSIRDVEMRAAQSMQTFPVTLNTEPVVDSELRAAVFDGGLHPQHEFPDYVVARDAAGLGNPVDYALQHGSQVTSAMLYGPLTNGQAPARAFAGLDHWRVIDEDGDDFELMATLDRIMDVLEQHPYDIVNLSIGPDESMLDHDVHVWTSRLDQFASSGNTLVISAAGNNGDMDEGSGLCRMQPAADGVNVLAVGAADRAGAGWARAPYSAKGPGRSPGLVKPDVLAFGGSDDELFFAADGSGTARGVTGTSFAAPSAARLGMGLKALFGAQLTPMAIKALLIHQADSGKHQQKEVGWGCLPATLDDLATCAEEEATVVYQGVLEPARFRRFFLPVPADGFGGKVQVKATFVAATAVDPEDAINYTRTGVGIAFRPKTVGHPGFYEHKGELRERSAHQTSSFFGKSAMFETEQTLRDDAQRWESVLKASRGFRWDTLDQPVFDIEHLARAHGQAAQRSEAVNYALIVTISERNGADLYNRIVRSYAGRLEAMRPQVDIPIRPRVS